MLIPLLMKKKLYLNKCSHFHIFHQRGRILLPSKYHSLRMWLSTSDSIHFYCREHTMCASKYNRTNMHIQNKWESSFCMTVCVCSSSSFFAFIGSSLWIAGTNWTFNIKCAIHCNWTNQCWFGRIKRTFIAVWISRSIRMCDWSRKGHFYFYNYHLDFISENSIQYCASIIISMNEFYNYRLDKTFIA